MTPERYRAAPDFPTYLASVQRNQEFWNDMWHRTRLPAGVGEEVAALGGTWNLLGLSEDWCGDAVILLPWVARLAEAVPGMEFRVLGRDANPDLMDAHLTRGGRSVPVVIVYDGDFVERGWWGPRPAPIQDWVVREGLSLPSPDRYREIRRWYARDRGRTTLAELSALLGRAAGIKAASPGDPSPEPGGGPPAPLVASPPGGDTPGGFP